MKWPQLITPSVGPLSRPGDTSPHTPARTIVPPTGPPYAARDVTPTTPAPHPGVFGRVPHAHRVRFAGELTVSRLGNSTRSFPHPHIDAHNLHAGISNCPFSRLSEVSRYPKRDGGQLNAE
ncbi:hypothetical protein GCM10010254_31580 [Streptomyces chromofuscus]|nr:hypothetical protein GCM10010254_31580 [Streptomyces chromofuscus]